MNTLHTGRVRYWNPEKDYGFIVRPEGRDIFFVGSSILGADSGARAPKVGEHVSFEERRTARGIVAVNVCNQADPASVAAHEAWNTAARQADREDLAAIQKRLIAHLTRKRGG